MYYYFYDNKKIIESVLPLPHALNPRTEALTADQVAFYLANPRATVQEVRDCALFEPPVPELGDVKTMAMTELKEAYCNRMTEYSELDVAMAVASQIAIGNLWLTALQTPYTLAQSKGIISGFAKLAKAAKAVYDQYAEAIASAATVESVEAALQAGKEAMDGVE